MNRKRNAFVMMLIMLSNLLMAVIAPAATGHQDSQNDSSEGTATSKAFLQSLTAREQAWLHEHPVIRVAQDPEWPPVEFINERGELSGMSEDYLNLVEQRLGVKFERIRKLSWQEAYARLKRWEIDMTTSVSVTPERTEFWAFTKPYMKIPIVIATNPNVTYIDDMKELAGKKIAVVEGYAVNDWIPRDFPGILLVRVKTTQEGLETLQRGEAFAYIDNLLILGDYISKLKVTNIKIAGQTPYVNAQCMAVRKDWATLAGILDKALESITVNERNSIYRKWLPIRYEQGFNYTLFWRVLAVFATILLLLMLWIWKLAKEIRHRKQTEDLLRESESLFKNLFKHHSAVKLILDPDTGDIIDANDAAEKFYGWTRDQLIQMKIQQINTLSQDEIKHEMEKVKTEQRFHFEFRHRLSDGSIKDVDVFSSSIKAKGKELLHSIVHDITARKQAEEALRRSEVLLNQTQQITKVGGWEYDVEKKRVYWTDEVYRIYGVSPGEYDPNHVGRDIAFYEDRDAIEKSFNHAVLTGESYDLVLRFKNALGVNLWVRTMANAEVKGGKVVRVFGNLMDITEHKQAEETRKNALRDWEYIFRAIGQPTLILDPKFRILEANSAALNSTGLTRPEIIGKICHVVFHGADHPPDDCPLARLNASGVMEASEMEVEALGGVYLVSCTPVFDNSGNLVKVIHIATDITQRKKAEEEILGLNTELEQRVLDRTAQLETANKDLEAFSYSVSHDLRAPLRAVDGYTRILVESLGPSLDAEGQRLCTAISDSAHTMGKLIDNLLAFSRFGRAAIRPSSVDMAALANSIFLELTTPEERDLINFIVGPLPHAQGDPTLLHQVWMNLLGNAVKFSSKTQRAVIEVSAQAQGNEIVYSIKDNGVGFDMRYADKLFGVFQRLHSTKEFEGTGVGLAIARRIIERHGGRVWAEGETGKGAVFYFTL